MRWIARLLTVSLTFAAFACGESDLSSDEPALDLATLAAPGAHGSTFFDFDLVDTSRVTAANGDAPGAPERHLPARIWYPTVAGTASTEPATDGPFPLIGYGHGFFSTRNEGDLVGPHLASHGYVMVAVDFPLSHLGTPGGASIGDMTNQPGDLSFAMEQVENGAAGAAIAAVIDRTRRGIAGLSLGGGTVLIGAYHPKWRIENIQAAVAYAPASCFFGPGLYQRELPLLIVSGDRDLLIKLADGPQQVFASAPPPATLVTLHGGNHVGFVGIEDLSGGNADEVGCTVVGTGGSIAGRDAALLQEHLLDGAPANVIGDNSCTSTCTTHEPQTMGKDRQRALTRAATLAHFEATLCGRRAAQRWLEETFGTETSDVTVEIRK